MRLFLTLASLCAGAAVGFGQQPLTLSEATRLALAKNPVVSLAAQRVAEAEAHVREMKAGFSPSVTLGAAGSQSNGVVAEPVSTQSYTTTQAAIDVGVPNFGRAKAQVRAAQGQVLAARAAYTRTLLDIRYQTAEAYFNALRGRDGIEIAKANLEQAQQQMADTAKRIGVGDLPEADLLKVQVAVAQRKAELSKARSAGRSADQALNSLLVRRLDSDLTLEEPPAEPVAVERSGMERREQQSPDIQEAKANLDSAVAAAAVARRGNDLGISLEGNYAKTSDITAYAHVTTFMISFSLPLFDGGAVRAQVRQADSQVKQARAVLDLAVQSVGLQTEQALQDSLAAQSTLDAAKETLDVAQLSAAKARQAYLAGLTTTRDVLDAQLAVAQAKSDAANARYDLAIARAKLRQLLGIL